MAWQEILLILVPLISLMGWIYNRIDKKFEKFEVQLNHFKEDTDKKFEKLDARFEKLDIRFDKLSNRFDQFEKDTAKNFSDVNVALSRIEGKQEEREFQEWKQKKLG